MPPRPLPPLSLYVHLPWCVRKCPYCDFNSYRSTGALPEAEYVEALLRDLEAESAEARGRPIASVFIGGGTPSLFSGAGIERLLDGVRVRVTLAADVEITLEANPGAADAARFAAYRRAGVTRLSIGVQSFRDRQLRVLGRVHDGRDAERAFAAAVDSGFENINLDLMYALPGDSPAEALADVETAIALGPAHISWYQLTLEPGTAYFRRPPPLPADETVLAIEDAGRALLERHGYVRYEISAYAQPGFRCRHNLNYWRFGDYIGIGAGAHGKLTRPEGGIIRRTKSRNPRTYLERAGRETGVETIRVDGRDVVLELMMNGLRLPEGIPARDFEERSGRSVGEIARPLAEAVDRGWMSREPGVLKATPEGLRMLNATLALFVDV